MHNTRSRAADLVGALIVPTGIGAKIGGHAGDATPVAKLLAACCDWLIVHPNVVNASDINEMPENALYVDGFTLDELIAGREGLKRCRRQNRILVVVNAPLHALTLNAVNAARHTMGADISILPLVTPLTMTAWFLTDGTATGTVTGVDELVEATRDFKFDALAIHTRIDCPIEIEERYFRDGGVNPWGGVEAMASRLISEKLRVPVAHAPLDTEDKPELRFLDRQSVHPRIAAEAVSSCYFHCVLKGLHDCPIPVQPCLADWTVDNLDFLVVPDGAPPYDVQVAVQRGTKVIRVVDNKTVIDEHMPSLDRTRGIVVKNYLEAAGIVACMRAGVLPESVKAIT